MQVYYDDIYRLKGNNFDTLLIGFTNEDLFNEFKENEKYDIRYPLLDNVRGDVVNSCDEYKDCVIVNRNDNDMSIKFSYSKKIYVGKSDKRKRIIDSIIN